MDIDTESADDERAVELSSIAAIYPEIELNSDAPFSASLALPVSPTNSTKIIFKPSLEIPHIDASVSPETLTSQYFEKDGFLLKTISTKDVVNVDVYPVAHFPPLLLSIDLPDRYPATEPPTFAISTNPEWLPAPAISRLVNESKGLWEECGRNLIVYSYIDHLQQSGESFFGLPIDSQSALVFPEELKVPLLEFDLRLKREKFEQETFVCGICLEPKKGQVCHRLQRCSHVFCVACLQDFYNTCIKEGDVDNVKCIDLDCGKEANHASRCNDGEVEAGRKSRRSRKPDFTLTPTELLSIPLEQQVVKRYAFLKRKLKLEADKSIMYCPRQWCQGAARSKRFPKPTDPMNTSNLELSDDEDETDAFDPLGSEDQLPPMEKRVAICEDCGYAFCRVCKKGWHGPRAFCYPRRAAELTAEEKATEDYMFLYTAQCPTCDFRCQKAMGCNHMICSRCKTHFCYLCSSWLFANNPYQHFNERTSKCYMRLWELEKGDGIGGAVQEQQDPFWAEESDHEEDEIHGAWQFAHVVNRDNRAPPAAPDPPQAIAPAHLEQAQQAVQIDLPHRGPPLAEAVNGNPRPAQNQGQAEVEPGQRRGLQRFLYLVQHDQEDEWDSDELEGDF
ncbi:hypothetical protein LOZ53_000507 [Ophidiomyces ophidiicola]|nr:hypothetical protein LOZ55_000825 [Ophidiomyces ophidiicola]KAI1992386.1 hypothetical protein LOZ54_001735 [Ophidiomyces ophidiicola]KAI1997500.1 hypothetical protein LOZ53_000507 [Ophidiomyces ophidiicola]KAI1998013.1 hypothetical protein LOZ51_002687 [Ophidiomyces ophidiicola]KAI2012650.1 hypothetical protein LOZ50_000109 [Ophidiomyces ophidiicola]